MNIVSSIRTWWRRLFSPPIEPRWVVDLGDAARLARQWRGVSHAEPVRFMVGVSVRAIVAVTFRPWVMRRGRLICEIAAEAKRRSTLGGTMIFMDASAVRRMLAAQAEAEQRERSRWNG